MSRVGAALFSWLHRARFYEQLHAEAVSLLGAGAQHTWLEVGTGPGLVAGLAAASGFRVTGIDRDDAMIRAARQRHGAEIDWVRAELEGLNALGSFDVVSAASLLIVLPDARAGLEQLWACVRPGGSLLIVETTAQMTPSAARSTGVRHPGLWLWARARSGRAVDAALFDVLPARARQRHSLFHGLAEAWLFTKGAP